MQKILKSLPQFISAIESRQAITCNKRGKWRIQGELERDVKRIFHQKKENDNILSCFHRVLSQIETTQSLLYFNATAAVRQKQARFYQDVIRAGRAVVQLHVNSKSKHIKELRNSLELSIIKMQYRIQLENGGLRILNSDEIDANMAQQLREKVKEWQASDEKYERTQPRDFSAYIQEICQYPEIVKFLLNPKNKPQCYEYFQRAIRDNFSIEVLNQYHYESKYLVDNFMACRIGAIARKLISVDLTPLRNGFAVKKLNLLMEDTKVNLLNKKQKVRFSNGLEWKLSRIVEKDFGRKKTIPGDLEIMWRGVVPHNGHELGPRVISKKNRIFQLFSPKKYAAPDTSKPGWFEKLELLDIRSKEYIEARYNIRIEPGQWVTVLKATRRHELDVVGAHGYTGVYQPIGNNNYRFYSFGAFPINFPQNDVQLVNFVGDTVKGTIAYPDPNSYYSFSQEASWAKPVSKEVACGVLNELGRLRKLGIIFQLGWENCAFLMRSVIVRVFEKMKVGIEVPDFFRKKFLKTKSQGALKIVQKLFKKVETEFKKLMPLVKLLIALFFRATRSKTIIESGKKIRKSLWKTPFFKQLKINIPSAMHYRIKQDRIAKEKNPDHKEKFADCVLNYGHSRNIVAEAAPAA